MALDKYNTNVVSDKVLLIGTAASVGVQAIILIVWTAYDPAVRYREIHLDERQLAYVCYSETSEIFMWIALGYAVYFLCHEGVLPNSAFLNACWCVPLIPFKKHSRKLQ
jgi:hypothetical protein